MPRWRSLAVLSMILAVYAAANLHWLREHRLQSIAHLSHAHHFRYAIEEYPFMEKLDIAGSLRKPNSDYTPAPLHSMLVALGLAVADRDLTTVVYLLNLLYFAAALGGTFLIGRRIGGEGTGLAAAALLASYPAVYGLSRLYGSFDFPVMAAAAVSVYALIRSEWFTDRTWSVLCGLSVGGGLLLKDSFAGFVLGPLVMAAVVAVTQGKGRARFVNMLLAFGVAFALAVPYYLDPEIMAKEVAEFSRESRGAWYAPENLKVYTAGMFLWQMAPIQFAAFLVGLAAFRLRGGQAREKALVLLWAVVPWLILMLLPRKKHTCYIIPYLPALALMTAEGLRALRVRRPAGALKVAFLGVLVGALVAVSAGQFLYFTFCRWDSPLYRKLMLRGINTRVFSQSAPGLVYNVGMPPPSETVVEALARAMPERGSFRVLAVTTDQLAGKGIRDGDLSLHTGSLHREVFRCVGWLYGLEAVRLTRDLGLYLEGGASPEELDALLLVGSEDGMLSAGGHAAPERLRRFEELAASFGKGLRIDRRVYLYLRKGAAPGA